jgi:hypothetical protein
MAITVIGLFEHMPAADAAIRNLVERGFDRERITVIEPGTESELAGSTEILNIASLPPEDAGIYREGLRRGAVLVAALANEEQADLGVEIMDRHGAIDVEERSLAWEKAGWQRPALRAAASGMPPPEVEEPTIQVGRSRTTAGGARVFVW